jgi:hypothetical protein
LSRWFWKAVRKLGKERVREREGWVEWMEVLDTVYRGGSCNTYGDLLNLAFGRER